MNAGTPFRIEPSAITFLSTTSRANRRRIKDTVHGDNLAVHYYTNVAFSKKSMELVDRLPRSTHFSGEEIMRLCNIYRKVMGRQLTVDQNQLLLDHMDRTLFRAIMLHTFEITDDFIMDRIFKLFASKGKVYLDMEEWICGLSVLVRGTFAERCQFCFLVYDLTQDGSLQREECMQFLKNTMLRPARDEDADEMLKDLVDLVMKRLDQDEDGQVSYMDYLECVEQDPLFLEFLGQCLPDPRIVRDFNATYADNEMLRRLKHIR